MFKGTEKVTGYMFENASGKFSFKHYANQGGTGNSSDLRRDGL